MEASSFVEYLKGLSRYQQQVVHVEHLPPSRASYGELDEPLHPALDDALNEAGLLPLYSHQAAAIGAALSGRNVVIVTPAASGKTLCYNVPVLQALLSRKGSRALYIFPTKALAQDQLRGLRALASLLPVGVQMATFDGDTPRDERWQIKRSAQIVLTNPDMLHLGVLPNHQSWARFLRRLRYVVVDEAHVYRGVFGSHMGNVLRRLRRVLSSYGADPEFICCSATIGNPAEHVEKLVGLPFHLVDEDGSPHGGKEFVFWDPPFIDETQTARRSANSEAAFLLAQLVGQGIRSLAFTRTRRLTELVYNYAREQLEDPILKSRISPYRGGYLPEERRDIERRLFQGELAGVVATTALELGIDVGDLDATVLTGYPGSIAATWQQAGRSGRRGDTSMSFLIGLDNPLDQYFMRHPEAFFGGHVESALTDPGNPYVLKSHLACAAWELPLAEAESAHFGEGVSEVLGELEDAGVLRSRDGTWYAAPSERYPAEGVNIRSTSSVCYTVVDVSEGERPIETIEASVAFFLVHPGAIHLNQGRSYQVIQLDMVNHVAYVVPADVSYYTQARDLTDLAVLSTERRKGDAGTVRSYLGRVEVTTMVVGYRKKMQYSEELISEEPLDLPPLSFETVALWFDIPDRAVDRISEGHLDLAGGLHAAEHACIAMLPLFALCDRNDLGGVSTVFHPDTGRAQVFVYDAHPGGTGIAEKGFELISSLWRETLKVVVECPCEEGCPSCIQSPKCGNNNQPLDKMAARIILEELAGPPA